MQKEEIKQINSNYKLKLFFVGCYYGEEKTIIRLRLFYVMCEIWATK